MIIEHGLTTKPRQLCAVRPVGFSAVLMAAYLLGSNPVLALEEQQASYSFYGFGTLGTVYSDEDQADFVSSWLLQPNGAGHTSEWHGGVDTKIGGQVNAQLNEQLSAVLQVVMQRQEDNAWTPAVEWANIQYQLNDELTVRIGRTVVASFMVSDTRLVGYANPWIRGPQEVYQIVPITNVDGIDLSYGNYFGELRNTLQVTYGQTDRDLVQDGELLARNAFILSNTMEYGPATFRLAYISADATLDTPDSNALFDGYAQLGETLALIPGQEDAAAEATVLSERYRVEDAPIEIYSAGIRLEPDNWLLMAEWARITEAGALPRTDAWYTTIGYRFSSLTPYLTLAKVNARTHKESGVSSTGMPPALTAATETLNAGLDQLLAQPSPAQRSITAGLRWDFSASAALKLQYQHIELDEKSAGRLGNVQPGFTPGNRVNTFSAAIDFVF
ncbi:MAG: hypothetical protein KBT88_14950 [Gammaproteobacteria bacterium]|nr:hypothetical protein [Gammaproteobacteria bacterium]MBQ0841077.1 hypothetical protein [Gammaproteobacteria bacterium]